MRFSTLTIAFVVVTVLCSTDRVLGRDDGQSELAHIVTQIDTIRERHGMASVYLVLVDRDRTILSTGMGIRAWDDPRPVSDGDYYRLGSVTKAFTGLALLKAEEQNCLDLDEQVAPLVPPFVISNRWQETHALTIAMLMEHTAGIHAMGRDEFDFNDPVSLEQALRFRPESRITVWPPGVHSEYSNSGPGVAGWVLQQQCNEDFDKFIEKNVFQALDMPSATLNRTDEVIRDLVSGYNTDPREAIEYWHLIFRSAGAANVRPMEMGNFLRMLINRGMHEGRAVFSAQQIDRMETPTTTVAARAGLNYGYGLGIYAENKDGHVFYGHGGDADGYLSRFSYSKESGKGFFVVITMFDFKPMREMRDILDEWMLTGLPEVTPPPTNQLDRARIDEIIGTYQRATIRFPQDDWREQTVIVSARGNRIGYACGVDDEEWCELIPVTDELFRLRDEPVATTAIVGVDGQMIFQGDLGNWAMRSEN